MSCLITMSQKELHRLELIQKIRDAISRGEDPIDVYRRADLALYAAKMRGRNQIAIDTNADLSPRLTG
jgi:GGDEF domain-containing protein